ncbi:MAG: hypothetical protein ACK6CT_14040, partial [Planctomycetia bacterium]
VPASPAAALSPRNPVRAVNRAGINSGAMQWERAPPEGRRAWPGSNASGRAVPRSSGAWVGGVIGGGSGAGTIIEAGGSRSVPRSSPRVFRRWRR